jgi:outer membrane protein OmpA-like peptidoglycan-associated protein
MHGTEHPCFGTAPATPAATLLSTPVAAMKRHGHKTLRSLLFAVAACACVSPGWAVDPGFDAAPASASGAAPKFLGDFPHPVHRTRATANPVQQILPAVPVIIPDLAALDPLGNVFFDFGSAEIRPDAAEALDALARKLTLDRRATVLLIGYSADLGSSEYGVALAGSRTRAVSDELLKRGVRPTQIRHRPRGNAVATGQCETDACRRMQQRVELRLVE